jgi:hypothetical protein
MRGVLTVIDPNDQLREMIGDLRYYRRELGLAEQHADEGVAASMRRMIRTEATRIREHCLAHSIAVPSEVPEVDYPTTENGDLAGQGSAPQGYRGARAGEVGVIDLPLPAEVPKVRR